MRRILIAIAFLALTTPSVAGVHRWTPIGPQGGAARQVIPDPAHPGVVWALVDGRPFRSSDGGVTWTERSAGLPVPGSWEVESLVIDPERPDTLLAASFGADLFRTTDGGISWPRVLGPSALGSQVDVVADPTAPGTFYATPSTTLLPMLRSTDHGATWARVGAPLEPGVSNYVESFAVDPATPGRWYAAIYGAGANRFFVSSDAGATWVQRGAGLPTQFSRFIVTATTPPTLWLYDTGTGLYRSTDGGATFSQSGLGRTDLVLIAADPGDPRTIYAIRDDYFQRQFFRSTDSGATWAAVDLDAAGLPTATLAALAVDPFDGAHLWAGTARDGVLVSADSGASWTPGITGLPRDRSVCGLAASPGGATLHAIADGSLWTSRDGGASWRPNTPDLVPLLWFQAVSGITIDPTDPLVVYAASSGGVFKSVDGAASWRPSSTGLPAAGATMVAVDPLAPLTLYATTASGVYRSRDGGASWALRGPGSFSTLVVDPTSPATIYFDGGVAVSRDGGATSAAPSLFAPLLGMPQGFLLTELVATVAPAPTSPGKVYAGVAATIFTWPRQFSNVTTLNVSGDRLATFTQVSQTTAPSALAVAPTDDLALYVGGADRAQRSRDGGATLEPFGAGIGGTPCVFAGGAPGEPLLAGTKATDSTTRAFGVYAIDEPACTADQDCADGADCTTDRCSAGRCTHDAVADGTTCGDPPGGCSDADGGRCIAGACRAFSGCDDGDPCTTDSCQMPGVCAHERIAGCCTSAAQCDDGDACTTDTCTSARCVSTVDPALCHDHVFTSTMRIVTRDVGSKVMFDTTDTSVLAPLVGSADDPSLAGATVDLFMASVPRATWALPAGVGRPGWKVKPAPALSYVFVNPAAPAGSVRRLALRVGRHLSLTAVASGDPIPTGDLAEVGIRITMGSRRLCALFAGEAIRANKPGRFVARGNLLPAVDCTGASFGGETP
jgi:photosystem II stability/assembly factor-like uncharacterized protein